jgi:hypothetical protein
MSKFKVGDTVVIVATIQALEHFHCSYNIREGRSFVIRGIREASGNLQLKNIDGSAFYRAWVRPSMVELVIPKVIPKVTQVIPKVTQVKPKSPRNHYSIQAKRNITREWLALPRGTGGRAKSGAVAALFNKYGVALKSTRHANSLLRGDTGWLQQYNNGGWDTSNAIAFKRTVGIKGVL